MYIEKGQEELAAHMAAESESFKAYAEKIASGEELDETDVNPVVEVDMPQEYFQCDLSGNLNRLAFSTADDPFYKQVQQRYYPEALVFNKHGVLQSRVGPDNTGDDVALNYFDDFRDKKLKINDDKKIQIKFNQYKEAGTMILLTVRQFLNNGQKVGSDENFDRAWVRLSNEETNQTIDYSLLNKIEIPDGYTEQVADDENENAPPKTNDLVYVLGVLYCEKVDPKSKAGTWVFESYKNALQSRDFNFADVGEQIGKMYSRALLDSEEQVKMLDDAGNALKRSMDARRKEEEEKAKKAKKPKGKKADDKPSEEVSQQYASVNSSKKEETFDTSTQEGFDKALRHHVRRPFLFGPIVFEGLDLDDKVAQFDPEDQRKRVTDLLERGIQLPTGLCAHGYKVTIKKRNLKRRSSLLKHARFLKNLSVHPNGPPPPVEEVKEDAEEDADD